MRASNLYTRVTFSISFLNDVWIFIADSSNVKVAAWLEKLNWALLYFYFQIMRYSAVYGTSLKARQLVDFVTC